MNADESSFGNTMPSSGARSTSTHGPLDDTDLGNTRGRQPAAASAPTGMTLAGRYLIQHRIGRGGMGVVYLGIDQKTQDQVAVKFIPDAIKSDEAAISELRSETRKGRRLTHRNIVSILELLDDNGEDQDPAIIMEYIDGPTLSALRVKQPGQVFDVDARFQSWVDQLLTALEYAHDTARIVHRDLKPANIMVTSAGVLKVADFGIACSMRDSVSRVSVSQSNSAGTLLYMSPQQYLGSVPSEADDIYALGATLYELLTGHPPFYRGDVAQQLKEIIPPSIAERRAELGVKGAPIPPAWEAVIAACLEKQPQNRPISIAAIRAGLAGEPFERGAKTLRGTIIRPGQELPAPATTTHQPAAAPAAPAPGAMPSWLPYAAAAAILAGGFWYYQNSAEAERRTKREREVRLAERAAEQRKRAQAEDKLAGLKSALDEARSYEESDATLQEKQAKYQAVVSEYAAFDYPYDDTEKQLIQDARDKADEFKNLITRVQTAYDQRLAALKEDLRDVEAKIRDSAPPMAAKARADLYNTLLADHSGFIEGFGTDHAALFAKIEKAVQEAEAEDKTTRPAALHPALAAISDPRVVSWKDYGRMELMKKAQSLLAAEPGLNRPVVADGKWNQTTQDALLAYQDAKKLPPTGKLDLVTVNALGLQYFVAGLEPKQAPVVASSSGGGGKSSTKSSNSTPRQGGTSQPAPSGSRLNEIGDFIMKAGIGIGASGIRPR